MQVQATVAELVALAEASGPLPELVRSVRAADGVIDVELDPTSIPDAPSLLRWVFMGWSRPSVQTARELSTLSRTGEASRDRSSSRSAPGRGTVSSSITHTQSAS